MPPDYRSILVVSTEPWFGPLPGRILLNFDTTAVKEEFERLKALGVTIIKEPYVMGAGYWVATLADPDGNLVQLTSPMEITTTRK